MATSGHVIVGGGSGFIGSYLCNALKNRGYNVTVISRMPGPKRISWNDIKNCGLPEDSKAVINLAGQNVLDPTRRWTEGFKQNVYNSRVNTTNALAKAICATDNPPSVFVTISGVGIYPASNTQEYTEETPVWERDFFSKLCLDWENAAKVDNCRQVTIRSGVVLGRDGGMIKQLYMPFYLGLGGPVGNGNQYLPWIHITDLTRLILFAVQRNGVQGILNGVAPCPVTNKEFSQAFAKALHRPALFPVPKFVLKLMLGRERASMLTEGQKVLPKTVLAYGFNFKYPDIESACHELIQPVAEAWDF